MYLFSVPLYEAGFLGRTLNGVAAFRVAAQVEWAETEQAAGVSERRNCLHCLRAPLGLFSVTQAPNPSTLMNSPASRRPRGFTLIELLVVIAIIVVLAAAGFSAGIVAMNHAKKLSSVATARALENAVNNFYTEYGSLPDVNYRVKTDGGEGVRLLNILLGLEESSAKMQNLRMIKLLNAVETKTKSKGLLYSANGRAAEGLYDAWGSPFTVEMDVNYEERLRVTVGDKTTILNGRRVAVYSPGADKIYGTTDDVKTW